MREFRFAGKALLRRAPARRRLGPLAARRGDVGGGSKWQRIGREAFLGLNRISDAQQELSVDSFAGLSRIIAELAAPDSVLVDEQLEWLERLIYSANAYLVPVLVVLPSPTAADVAAILGVGASGLIVEADAIQNVKEIIRTTEV